ncbi:DUF3343 domain-containing protein [Anaerobranca gottschalkii]|uniref:Putative Se/S carrier protein-like domain-containing protein n=1 Tax=Anaerobranca gottschalkii DSM 13577 TaxID=1120990 RepID=A0A1I0BLG6_9FIRM|nr:DUF3343 domain-containing protein [Anaerobranca gottschalkii]SET07696.1 Protein of unknown function [Anaerobranca gottschalkii DSM 13577]
MKYKLLAFESNHDSLMAEDLLLSNGITIDPIPVPRHLRKDCNLGLKIKEEDITTVESILTGKIQYHIYDYQM